MSHGPDATANTPLAPSVEKAYYRKCIELKRRLNEVESANDDAKVRRTRLERGIMKMRLERAFLLDELKKRMDYNVDDSEGSGEDTMATPPIDRPHRDKRRRPNPLPQSAAPMMPMQQPPSALPRQPSDPQHMKREFGQPEAVLPSQPPIARSSGYMAPPEYGPPPPHPGPPPGHAYNQSSAYQVVQSQPPRPMSGTPCSHERRTSDRGPQPPPGVNREAGTAGEALSAGPTVRESSNGERRVVSSEHVVDGGREAESGFTAVNN